jgi:hypothetical protein
MSATLSACQDRSMILSKLFETDKVRELFHNINHYSPQSQQNLYDAQSKLKELVRALVNQLSAEPNEVNDDLIETLYRNQRHINEQFCSARAQYILGIGKIQRTLISYRKMYENILFYKCSINNEKDHMLARHKTAAMKKIRKLLSRGFGLVHSTKSEGPILKLRRVYDMKVDYEDVNNIWSAYIFGEIYNRIEFMSQQLEPRYYETLKQHIVQIQKYDTLERPDELWRAYLSYASDPSLEIYNREIVFFNRAALETIKQNRDFANIAVEISKRGYPIFRPMVPNEYRAIPEEIGHIARDFAYYCNRIRTIKSRNSFITYFWKKFLSLTESQL